jgi:putative molybdopterin biosynthesis protein
MPIAVGTSGNSGTGVLSVLGVPSTYRQDAACTETPSIQSPHFMARQEQFLDVIDRDEAERRFHAQLDLRPLGAETVSLGDALGRVLAEQVAAPVDIPGFDRSNVDGFAVRAADTYGASEEQPRALKLNAEVISPGSEPRAEVAAGTATTIATGAMIPRGADAVMMVEHTDETSNRLAVYRPVTPGAHITFAGTDIARGESILRRGQPLTSRETGVLAAIGVSELRVYRRPRVAVLSTGDEIIAPGRPMRPGLIYDSNAVILADAVRELGGEPVVLGIFPDDKPRLCAALQQALSDCDLVLLSGGTSKGAGDLNYRVVGELKPGIIVHGVALKPGKPICLAVAQRRDGERQRRVPVVILPGFPTSAVFTFHEFVAPVLRALGGRGPRSEGGTVQALLPMRVNSERGRTEYLLVSLVQRERSREEPLTLTPDPQPLTPTLVAYPMGKGSGSVTAFSRADGFITIGRNREYLDEGELVEVRLLGRDIHPADLVVIGSHCVGLDMVLSRLGALGYTSKFLAVGSQAGLAAARRAECDLAGVHLLDPETDTYNTPFLDEGMELIPGYTRQQGIVFRTDDARFRDCTSAQEALNAALADSNCRMVNRNRGSGTRSLIDRLLGDARPPGYAVEPRNHQAVAAAITQCRADWGVAIAPVARDGDLGFLPLRDECYDFVAPTSRRQRPAVRAFCELLASEGVQTELRSLGLEPQTQASPTVGAKPSERDR